MKPQPLLIALAALLASTAAFAGNTQAPESTNVPVLVQVNDQGTITRATPAYTLSPKLDRLLQENLAEMIRTPALAPNGKAVASQFVIDMALQRAPLADDSVSAKFVYVAIKPIAPGHWYWAHNVAGHALALVNASDHSPASQRASQSPSTPASQGAYLALTPPPYASPATASLVY